MKILILANNDVGLFQFRKELIQKLLENHEVFVSLPDGEFVPKLEQMGCTFFDTKISRHGTNPITDLKLLIFYKKLLKKIRPDVVLTYTIKPNIYGGLACRRLKIPYIVNITGLGNAIENSGIVQKISLWLYKTALKKATKVFFQNDSNQDFMLVHKCIHGPYGLLPGSGVNVIEHCFETYPENSEKIRFVTIGRILKDKGIYELLDAIRIIKNKYANTEFVLIGGMDGNYNSLIENAEKEKLIQYLGKRNDIHLQIKNSHATVHPSYHEGTSNVLLETAACGRPILASNVPGCNNTFDDGITGIAFEPKNVDSLVNALERFINLSYSQKAEMGKRGREKMEREFNRDIVIEKYLEEINEIEVNILCQSMKN